jgi:hypothetical protein
MPKHNRLFVDVKLHSFTANFTRAIMVDDVEDKRLVSWLKNSISAPAVEAKVFAVKSPNHRVFDGADTVALVLSAVEVAAEADALVAVLPDPLSWFVNFVAIKTWAVFTLKTFITVDISSEWTVAAFNTVLIRAADAVRVEARRSTRATADVVFLALWAFNWAPAVGPPVDVDTVSGAFSKVSGHSVARSAF